MGKEQMERIEERVVTELGVVIPEEFGPAMAAAFAARVGRGTPGVIEEFLCSSIGIYRRAKC